jgi:hypothetical protein
METQQVIWRASRQNLNLKKSAKVSMTILLLYVVAELASVYQTRHELATPLIPESTIWEINKQFIFHATASAIVSVAGLILYFFDKYLLVIILVVLTLIINRFIGV